jgi:hypothetical protein
MRAFYQADPRGAVPPPLPSVEPSPQLAKLIAIALRDLEGGLEPIGVAGKRPTAEGWQEGEITEERIRADFSDEHTGIGWRTGNLSAADVDIQDPELNGAVREIVHQMLSPTPYERIGADPKILLVYRNETPIKKITVSGVMKARWPSSRSSASASSSSASARIPTPRSPIVGSAPVAGRSACQTCRRSPRTICLHSRRRSPTCSGAGGSPR